MFGCHLGRRGRFENRPLLASTKPINPTNLSRAINHAGNSTGEGCRCAGWPTRSRAGLKPAPTPDSPSFRRRLEHVEASRRVPPPGCYFPSLIQSATRSAIMMVVALVLARITSGMTEASTTRSPSRPWTWPYWLTTAIPSELGPILQVPET